MAEGKGVLNLQYFSKDPAMGHVPHGAVDKIAELVVWKEQSGKMMLKSTMVCVDSDEYMQNGDFLLIQLQAQQNAANVVCHSKTGSNPENNVGLVTLDNDYGVVTTLTPDTGHILSKLSNPRAIPLSALASKRPIWL
jgi:hypothetical protein